jgi:SAM-dependent methyltransferase
MGATGRVGVGQEDFFDIEEHQYAQALVQRPPRHTAREIDAIISRLRRHGGVASVVDFGAGSGRLTIPLLRRRYSVLAVDGSDRSLDNLRRLAQRLRLPPPPTARRLPRHRRYDAVVGTDILHHVDLDVYLPAIHDTLRAGGRIIFSEPGGCNPTWYIYLPLTAPWHIEKGVRRCTYLNLRRKLAAHGFGEASVSGLGLLPRPFFNWSKALSSLNDALGNLPLIKLFAYRYIIEASARPKPDLGDRGQD